MLVVSAARLASSELSKAEFPSLGQWNGPSPGGLARKTEETCPSPFPVSTWW